MFHSWIRTLPWLHGDSLCPSDGLARALRPAAARGPRSTRRAGHRDAPFPCVRRRWLPVDERGRLFEAIVSGLPSVAEGVSHLARGYRTGFLDSMVLGAPATAGRFQRLGATCGVFGSHDG